MSQFTFFYPILSFHPSIPCSYGFYQQIKSSPLYFNFNSIPFEQNLNFDQAQSLDDIDTPSKQTHSRTSNAIKQTFNVAKRCRRMRRKERKLMGDQKENRNVFSNILRNFFRKINDFSRIETIVKQTITRHQLQISAQDFVEFLHKMKIDHSRYIRIKSIKQYFFHSDSQCSILLRVLYQHYSKEEVLLQTLTSRKIGAQSVKCHLEGINDLAQRLFNGF